MNWFKRSLARVLDPLTVRSIGTLTLGGRSSFWHRWRDPALQEMWRPPDGLEVMNTVRPAEWVKERLWTHNREKGVLAGEIVPEGFDSYVRVFHPAERQLPDLSWEKVSWFDVAEWNGKVVHPQMQFHRMANATEPPRYRSPEWGQAPSMGDLPEDECRSLVSILKEFTSTPERCYFCLWHGYGFLGGWSWRRTPTLKVPDFGREYFLLEGPLDAVMSFYPRWRQSPNIWWPEDRTWCVATEIDFMWTFVGGSEECIEKVLACPDLEALPISLDARVDAYGDTINV